jgi:bifunctional DNA-binding transcriptional regulator/antitoxin component of YhaV-PrlF toxin-antitoxin module
MPKVSSKRQITLPVDQCQQLGIEPGDEYQSYVADGRITIVKKMPGAAKGVLRHLKGDASLSDEESLQSTVRARRTA